MLYSQGFSLPILPPTTYAWYQKCDEKVTSTGNLTPFVLFEISQLICFAPTLQEQHYKIKTPWGWTSGIVHHSVPNSTIVQVFLPEFKDDVLSWIQSLINGWLPFAIIYLNEGKLYIQTPASLWYSPIQLFAAPITPYPTQTTNQRLFTLHLNRHE